MREKKRNSGIDIIGDVLWGSHLCQFYQTKKDLTEILAPYFKAGLKQNEFCLWVTSEPLTRKEAEEAMIEALPNFDQYLKRGQIKIIPHTQWYLKDGIFNLQRVLNSWVDELKEAKAQGYDGMRVAGNTGWLEQKDLKNFAEYEEVLNKIIAKQNMIALCTYPFDRCGVSEFLDVVKSHKYALIKKDGDWDFIQSSEHLLEQKVLQEAYDELEKRVEQGTAELKETNRKLQKEIEEQKRFNQALQK